jgi:hypothetical protein
MNTSLELYQMIRTITNLIPDYQSTTISSEAGYLFVMCFQAIKNWDLTRRETTTLMKKLCRLMDNNPDSFALRDIGKILSHMKQVK